MLQIEKTNIIGRYNLIDDTKDMNDDNRYLRQLSLGEVQILAKSIIDLMADL